MDQPRQPILFVSHPSTKAETAGHIERALNARGVSCWIAPRDVEPGEQWDVAIRSAIKETDAMLLLFCADSERSRQVKRELILADQFDKPIIPMRLERIEPHELSYHLADSQWIDWIEQRDEAIERIAARAREFQAQRTSGDGSESEVLPPTTAMASTPPAAAPPPAPPSAPAGERKSLLWLWLTLGGVALATLIGFAVWWFAIRDTRPNVGEQWFAGTWSDTRSCEDFFRFDLGGSLTTSEGLQGTWRIEDRNMLVMEVGGMIERRALRIISNNEVSSPTGRAYRCL